MSKRRRMIQDDGNSSAYGNAQVEYINIPRSTPLKKRTYPRKAPAAPRKRFPTKKRTSTMTRAVPAAMPLYKKLLFTYNEILANATTLAILPATPFTQKYTQYKINSLYDLNANIGNTATVGFNEWSQFYNKYHVKWARITTTFINTGSTACHVGIVFRPIANEPTWNSWTDWRNATTGNNYPCKTAMLTPAGGSMDRVTLSVSCPLGYLWGRPIQNSADVGFSADVNTNPLFVQDAFVFMLDVDGVLNALYGTSVNTKTTIKVIAEMYQRKTLFV